MRVVRVVKVHGKGRIQIPAEVRKMFEIQDGDLILIYINDRGEVCMKKFTPKLTS